MSKVEKKLILSGQSKINYVLLELAHHVPFSIFGVSLSIILLGLLNFLATIMQSERLVPYASENLFHIFHTQHILFSAITTTAMFWKHEKKLLKAIFVGFMGTIPICGLSDIGFPYFGGLLLGKSMSIHICILEEPGLVLPFAFLGIFTGLFVAQTIERSTEYSHSAHVFISSAASLLYLLSFGVTDWMDALGGVFMITIFAVIIPCCLSDIIFPLSCAHVNCNHSKEDFLHEH